MSHQNDFYACHNPDDTQNLMKLLNTDKTIFYCTAIHGQQKNLLNIKKPSNRHTIKIQRIPGYTNRYEM